ncbi:MAG: signal peptidase II [Phycisphaerae bacterium]|nr:signal peptidase II [Phycisphaerae bacterium]MDD5380909.1 signal peptidase II [Phycisphaerae bacterium]
MKREENNTPLSSNQTFLKRLLSVLPDLRAHLIFWPLVVIGIALDLWSKSAVFDWLVGEHNGSFSIIDGFLRLVMAVNDGAAFGLFAGHIGWLTVVSCVALVAIFAVFLFGGARQRLVNVALGLFAAGVCGNLYDRIFNDGLVRDFIDVYYRQHHWPAFNIADSMLCIAVGLGIISCFQTPKHSS